MHGYVIRIVGLAGEETQRCSVSGHFIRGFDVKAHGGRGLLDTTTEEKKAMVFESPEAAWTYWTQSYGTRPDGRPNAPLTAFTVSIEALGSARNGPGWAFINPDARA